jgi:hypothetical protein
MTMKAYRGSCQCKKVQFEVEIDLDQGTTRCNCTSCTKRRWWGAQVKPDKLRPISGDSELVKLGNSKGPGGFCNHCGVIAYSFGEAAEWNDGDYYSINVAALDGLSPEERAAIPIRYLDGLHDTWAPLETGPTTRYL